MLRSCRLFSVSVAAGTALALTASPAAAAQTPLGAATPQAVIERMTKAGATKDLREMVACLDPDSRTELSMGLLMGTTMIVAFMSMGADMAMQMGQGIAEGLSGEKMKPEDKAKMEKGKAEAAAKMATAKSSLSAVYKKYGLPDFLDEKATLPKEKDAAMDMLKKVDQPALAADLFQMMDKFGDKPDASKQASKDADSPVPVPQDVKDYKISGNHATAKSGNETLDFVKVDGQWFFKPPKKDEKKEAK